MARLVAYNYSQVPGVDFSENYSTVVYDITYHILILLMIIYGYDVKIVLFIWRFGRRNLHGVSSRSKNKWR